MGRPSDKRFSAQRPGRRERARVKKRSRSEAWGSVGGAISYHVKAGGKKYLKVHRWIDRLIEAHRNGDSITLKSVGEIKRPLYTIAPVGSKFLEGAT